MDRNELLAYAAETYGVEPEYPWKRLPSFGVLRHPENKKWFGLVASVERSRLGLPGAELLSFDDGPVHSCAYEETASYQVTAMFINNREQILHRLLKE